MVTAHIQCICVYSQSPHPTPPYPTWPYWAAETPALSSTYPPPPPLPPFREADRDIFPVPPYLSQFAAEILLQECQGKRHHPLGQCCHHLPCQLSSPSGLLYLLQLVVIIIAIIAAILLTLISEPTHPLFEPTGSCGLVHLSVYLVASSLPFSFHPLPLPSFRTVCLIVVGVTTSNSQ